MGRRAIAVKDFVRDVRAGIGDSDLMKKYGLSRRVLDEIFSALLKAGTLHPSDLMRDVSQAFESTLVVATTCQRCGALLLVDSGECSNCLANQVSQLIDEKERSGRETEGNAGQVAEEQGLGSGHASDVPEPPDESLPDDRSLLDDDTEIKSQPPESEKVIPEESPEPSELHQLPEPSRRAPAAAVLATILLIIAVPLGVLLYTGALEPPDVL